MTGRSKCLLIIVFLFVSQVTFSQKYNPGKPNIIFIMADDLGYETLECDGNASNHTPNLNKLANSGMRFTQAYATPLCTPTRVQVMTGKYNFRNYIGFGLLNKKETTFADLLKKEGYVVGIAGKWQLFGYKRQWKLAGGKKGSYPEEAGFDEYCLWQIDTVGSRYKDPVISSHEGTKVYYGKYGPDIFSNFAMNFIEKYQDTSFFLYYPMVLTHAPFQPIPNTPEFNTFDVSKKISDTAYFRNMVEYMDMLVGRIIDKIHELDMDKNTLIIFTGDNGTNKNIISVVNRKMIRGDKGHPTKYGTHVPLIARWEGVIKPGQVNDNLIDFTDFLPTFMDVAGAKLPADFYSDGISFYKQLRNEKTKERKWVFGSYDPNWGSFKSATYVHNKRWKLYSDGRFYDVKNDPEELNSIPETALTPKARKAKKKLAGILEKYEKEKGL